MDRKRTSKFLSLILRHKPDAGHIRLDPAGWADVAALLEGMAKAGRRKSFEQLVDVVESNDKQRFSFNSDRTKIRAAQGHSTDVDLGYAPKQPPPFLFHGTVERFLQSIRAKGLIPGNRQFVHLSADLETAVKVGARRGKPVILNVDSGRMWRDGHVFHMSENGVWLTPQVPPDFILPPTGLPCFWPFS